MLSGFADAGAMPRFSRTCRGLSHDSILCEEWAEELLTGDPSPSKSESLCEMLHAWRNQRPSRASGQNSKMTKFGPFELKNSGIDTEFCRDPANQWRVQLADDSLKFLRIKQTNLLLSSELIRLHVQDLPDHYSVQMTWGNQRPNI